MQKETNTLVSAAVEASWSSFYRLAGAGALIAVVFILLDIILSFSGGDVEVGRMSVVDWFTHFQTNGFLGLRNLGFFNVLNTALTIPLYLALYRLHHKIFPAYALLAMILFLMGAAIYTANNRALSMLALSSQYASAASEVQKTLLAAAGTVNLSQAEDFTPGSFTGFFLSSTASIVMMGVILRGRVFSKWLGLTGLIGSSCLLFFTISATFIPAIFDLAMFFALTGGLLMMGWNICVALGLFRPGRTASDPGKQAAPAQITPAGKSV